MTEHLVFELLTPVKKLIAKSVTMVTVPGAEGDFGVLPGHAQMIASVRPGVVEIYENEKITKRVFISGGFADVCEDRCSVLTHEVVPVEDLMRPDLEAQVRELSTALTDLDEGEDVARAALAHKLLVAQTKLDIIKEK